MSSILSWRYQYHQLRYRAVPVIKVCFSLLWSHLPSPLHTQDFFETLEKIQRKVLRDSYQRRFCYRIMCTDYFCWYSCSDALQPSPTSQDKFDIWRTARYIWLSLHYVNRNWIQWQTNTDSKRRVQIRTLTLMASHFWGKDWLSSGGEDFWSDLICFIDWYD